MLWTVVLALFCFFSHLSDPISPRRVKCSIHCCQCQSKIINYSFFSLNNDSTVNNINIPEFIFAWFADQKISQLLIIHPTIRKNFHGQLIIK